jgi:hypothetical protein
MASAELSGRVEKVVGRAVASPAMKIHLEGR